MKQQGNKNLLPEFPSRGYIRHLIPSISFASLTLGSICNLIAMDSKFLFQLSAFFVESLTTGIFEYKPCLIPCLQREALSAQ